MGQHVAYHSFKRYSSLRGFCADQGYRGTTADFVRKELKMKLDITQKSDLPGFNVAKTRWVVERFFAWIGNFRRFSKDFEYLPETAEQFLQIAAIMLILNRL